MEARPHSAPSAATRVEFGIAVPAQVAEAYVRGSNEGQTASGW